MSSYVYDDSGWDRHGYLSAMFGLEILVTFKQRMLCICRKTNEMTKKIQYRSLLHEFK